MHPHGNWASTLAHDLSGHAGTFLLEGRGSQVISLTWPSVLDGIKHLQANSENGLLVSQENVLFTHRLFRVRVSVVSIGFVTH